MCLLSFEGNPGIIEYYEEFLQEIYDNFEGKLHVCGLSHAGHDEIPDDLHPPSPNGTHLFPDSSLRSKCP